MNIKCLWSAVIIYCFCFASTSPLFLNNDTCSPSHQLKPNTVMWPNLGQSNSLLPGFWILEGDMLGLKNALSWWTPAQGRFPLFSTTHVWKPPLILTFQYPSVGLFLKSVTCPTASGTLHIYLNYLELLYDWDANPHMQHS